MIWYSRQLADGPHLEFSVAFLHFASGHFREAPVKTVIDLIHSSQTKNAWQSTLAPQSKSDCCLIATFSASLMLFA
jgi:hypothetical protein